MAVPDSSWFYAASSGCRGIGKFRKSHALADLEVFIGKQVVGWTLYIQEQFDVVMM